MPHSHQIYDSDKHFVIDPITRNITNNSSKLTIMQYDHNSERFTFEIPRIIEGHDMSLSDAVRVHFINIGSIKTNTNPGVYEVDDVEVSLDDPDTITFSWLISGASTKYNGSLHFAIRFYCLSDESEIEYSWGTNIYSGINVANSIDNSETIAEDYVDVLEKWKQDVIDTCFDYANDVAKVDTTLSEAGKAADAKAVGDTLAGKQNTISDLEAIRTGAAKGATALQSVPSTYRTASEQDTIDSGKVDKVMGKGLSSNDYTDADKAKVEMISELSGNIGDLNDLTTEAKNNLVAAINEAAQAGGGGGTVPKPLTYDYMPEGYPSKSGWSIMWDGNTDGLVSADTYYKVSDMMPTDDELIGATLKTNNGVSLKLSSDDITVSSEDVTLIVDGESGFVVRKDNVTLGNTLFPQKGTYLATNNGFYVAELSNQTITPMAEEFLPPLVAETKSALDRKADIESPKFTGAFSHNRKADSIIGIRSFAEGDRTTASGIGSHAEGAETTASSGSSHAEGSKTTASGGSSHAEGSETTASSEASHAEGSKTTASGGSSHAEGSETTASSEASHAEGYRTTANGAYSHAEGWGTTANGDCSHVEGKYNIEDTTHKYAHIVGNGASDTYKTNAYTLDWAGNGWFAGNVEADANILRSSATDSTKKFKLTVDDSGVPSLTNTEDSTEVWTPSDAPTKTSQLENDSGFVAASELADKQDKLIAGENITIAEDGKTISATGGGSGSDISLGLTGATVGQIAKITAVDDSGKPTAWQAVDMPLGGGGSAETFELIKYIKTTEAVNEIRINADDIGEPFELKEVQIYTQLYLQDDANSTITIRLHSSTNGSSTNYNWPFIAVSPSVRSNTSANYPAAHAGHFKPKDYTIDNKKYWVADTWSYTSVGTPHAAGAVNRIDFLSTGVYETHVMDAVRFIMINVTNGTIQIGANSKIWIFGKRGKVT